ncbi:MAG: KTSC domain-containing protein [Thermoleophilia bacterium]
MPVQTMDPVESNAVKAIGYDGEAEETCVVYLDGGLYACEGVPAGVFEKLTSAQSKGTFVNAVIKEYPVREVGGSVRRV